MKWIGQHIYNYISRFRSHTYFEDSITLSAGKSITMDEYTSGTISITKIQDSGTTFNDNDTSLMTAAAIADKIEAYGYSTTAGDITGVTAGTGLSGGGTSGAVTLNVAATQPVIESIGTDGDTLSILGDQLDMINATTEKPLIKLMNTTDDATSPQIALWNRRTADSIQAGEDSDVLGIISFRGYDDQGTPATQWYSSIYSDIHDATSGEESGRLTFQVANHDGGLGSGLILTGGSADDTIDSTIGLGTSSTTTVAGDLTVTSDLTVNGDTVTFQSANADDPIVTIKNTSNDVNDMASLNFVKDRGAASTVGTNLAEIYFTGEDADQNAQEYGRILCETDVVTGGQESGVLKFGVANHDGGNGYGLIMTGGSVDNEIDVTLGLGAASVVTIPGDIDLAGDIDVDGTLEADAITLGGTALGSLYSPIAGSESIETVGTIGEGTWQGAKVSSVFANTGGRRYNNVLKILPSDFITNIDGGNTKHGVGFSDTAGATDYGIKIPNTAVELHAFVSIPEGMKATHVDIYDKNNVAFEVFEVQINATTITSKGSGNCNTTLNITDVNATATNILDIKVTTTSVNDRVYGGIVTIAVQ